ncbi:MAG: translesion DNA synthesis-associated protein ImuA [Acidovorax sp.]
MSASPISFPPPQSARQPKWRTPNVWRADQLAVAQAVSSGHAALDACLPGGGWPMGALCEVVTPPEARLEWPLVLPALVRRAAQRAGWMAVVAPPHEPFAPALQAAGLPVDRLCWMRPAGAQAAWVAEQALRCRDVLAVLVWLPPRVRPDVLRRLHLAAARQGALLWGFVPPGAVAATPAPLRLAVYGGADGLTVQVLKRQGPAVLEPIGLPAGGRLAMALAAQAQRRAAMSAVSPAQEFRHGTLDRLAVAAR